MRVSIKTRETVGDVASQTTLFFDHATPDDVIDVVAGLDAMEEGIDIDDVINGNEDAMAADRFHHDFIDLQQAVLALYTSAWWSADRSCDSEALWDRVRAAAFIEPGYATKVLGAPPIASLKTDKDSDEPPLFLSLVNFFRDVGLASDTDGPVDLGLAYDTAKMFMARWRRSVGHAKPGDEDALARYETIRARVNDLRAAKLRVERAKTPAMYGGREEDCLDNEEGA